MLILQALLLWLIVSTFMVTGAAVFHRLFPQESPWFGFIIPPLVFILLLNFIEHFVALPSLLCLLPLFLGALIWLIMRPDYAREKLVLPTWVFLVSFAFTFGIRCLQPDILHTSDGISDLNMINSYSQGETLPPIDAWMPPFRFESYYGLQHYAASLVKRLLDLKLGVAANVSHALLSSLTCVAAAGAAHRISGGKLWITLAVPFLIESAATGSSAYILLTSHDPSLWLASDLSGGVKAPPDDNLLWKWLAYTDPHQERLELQPPGFWTWRDEYHANAGGHFLTLLAVFVIAELTFLRKTIWPWVMALLMPMLAAAASTWALPITVLLCWGMVAIAWLCQRRPASPGLTSLIFFGALLLLWPTFYNVSSSPLVPEIMWTKPEWRVPLLEFLIQWWPILALWTCGLFYFRQLSIEVRWIMLIVPLMLIGIEFVTIESRYNTVEKMWGYTYGAALVALFPVAASRLGTALAPRLLTLALLFSALISLSGFLLNTWRWAPGSGAMFHLEGDHYVIQDEQKKKMFHVLTQTKHATYLSGKCNWCYYQSPTLAVFSENRSYMAWSWFESLSNNMEEAEYREKLTNDFYSGAMTNRLKFLRSNNITGVLIWPDDNIPPDVLDALTKELESSYDYIDCRGTGATNAGVFILRPLPSQG